MDAIIAETPRLLLRELTAQDWQGVHAYTGDEIVSRYQAWAPHSEKDAQAWVALAVSERQKDPRLMYYWGICLRDSDPLIGGLGIHVQPDKNAQSAEIGYSLHPSYWSKGLGSEAVSAALDYIFTKTSLRRVVAHCRDINAASIGLLEKAGFRREGYFKDDVQVRGELMSSYWYALLRSEYPGKTTSRTGTPPRAP